MGREVRFTDLFGMPERSSMYSDANNLLEDLYSSISAPSFRVTIKATHSGYLLNNRVYPGSGVKAGASSWVSKDNGGTAGYDKPFLKHHDSKSEPIGRIDAQKFVQLWEDDQFKNDWKNPDHGTKPGSGYIIISGTVSDKDAQQKILDGRYKTVSTGQSSNKAYCSICGHDWLSDADEEEEICNHRPGRVYDIDGIKYRAYLVTGKMKYMECSFVNHPANELAGILSADFDSAVVPESKEQTVEVVTADTLGGVCSIVLADSEGRVTELIRSPDDKDEIPYGQDNAKRPVRVSVPDGFDIDKDGSRSKKLDWPKSLGPGYTNANYDIEEIAASIKNTLKYEVIKELADSSLTSNSRINTDKQSGKLNNPEGGKDAQNTMSTKKEDKVKDEVTEDTSQTDKPVDRTIVVLEKALEDSQARTAELEAELAKAKQLYDTKISEYNCLMDENAALTEEFKKQLASQLVTMQMQLQKPQVKSVTDHQSFGEAVTHVAARSVESLRDSIGDLVPELASSFKSNGLPSFIKDRVEEKPPVAKSVKEENVSAIKKTDIDPMDQI